MSAAAVVIIISNPRPKRQSAEKLGPVQVEVLPQDGDTNADLLRRAADLLEGEDD